MAKLIHSELEGNPHNENGTSLAFYFDGTPSDEDVVDACKETIGIGLSLLRGEDPEWDVYPTAVSKRAGLVRVLVFNIG